MAYFNHIDDEFDFGKYKGLSLSDVMDLNPSYITWCMFNVGNSGNCSFNISDEAMKELISIYPEFLVSKRFEDSRIFNDVFDYDDCESINEIENTYNCYNGSYAQDEMGYSDDDIDTVFDGDPMAYWNID